MLCNLIVYFKKFLVLVIHIAKQFIKYNIWQYKCMKICHCTTVCALYDWCFHATKLI